MSTISARQRDVNKFKSVVEENRWLMVKNATSAGVAVRAESSKKKTRENMCSALIQTPVEVAFFFTIKKTYNNDDSNIPPPPPPDDKKIPGQ